MKYKFKTQSELVKIVRLLKKQHKKVVTFNGSFDVLHSGHIGSIREAKNQGDALIILLNSDRSVKNYKGPLRPIMPQAERAELLTALEDVDYVTIFDEINPIKILGKIKPDVHCNGSDWGRNCVEREIVEKDGGRLHILKWKKGKSTSLIIEKIVKVFSQKTIKAVFLDRDGTINKNKEGYISKIEDFELTPYALKALRKLSKTDYKLIIITNQSGIGRGYYKLEEFYKFNDWVLKYLKKQGIRIDQVYFCPHHPKDFCDCRKPNIGMLLKATRDFGISLNDSWIIGDDERDIIMGRSANLKTIKLGQKIKFSKLQPNFYASNLLKAANVILDR